MPTSIRWVCPTELTAEEKRVAQALHRIGKFYVFLREIRAELFDEAFQAELAYAVEEVMMESTAQYWRPVCDALERDWQPTQRRRGGRRTDDWRAASRAGAVESWPARSEARFP